MFLAAIMFRARLCFNGYMWWLYLCVVQPCRSKSRAQNSSWRGFNAHTTGIPGEFISGSLLPDPVLPLSTSNLKRLGVLLNHHFCFNWNPVHVLYNSLMMWTRTLSDPEIWVKNIPKVYTKERHTHVQRHTEVDLALAPWLKLYSFSYSSYNMQNLDSIIGLLSKGL